KTDNDLVNPTVFPFWFHQPPTMSHFTYLFQHTYYGDWVYNTMVIAICVSAIALLVAVPAGYALARVGLPGAENMGIAIFLGYLIPPILLFIPLSRVVGLTHLIDTKWALVLVYPTFTIPYCTWLMSGFFKTVPPEIEEAAQVDGCGRLGALLRTVIPVSWAGILTAVIFAFTLSMQDFLYSLVFVSVSDQKPVPLGVATDRIAGLPGEPAGSGPVRAALHDQVTLALPGCTVLAGLIDFHSHLGIDTRRGHLGAQIGVPEPEYTANGISRMQEDLRAGATTLRLCGDRHGIDLSLRRAVEEGRVAGPRLIAAGRAIRSPRCSGGAVASVLTDDPDEIDRAVRGNLEDGADFIKVFVSDGVGDPAVEPTTCYYGEAHVAAAARRAHDAGRRVAAHLLGGPGLAAALGGGLDVIEHGWFLTDPDLDLVGRSGAL